MIEIAFKIGFVTDRSRETQDEAAYTGRGIALAYYKNRKVR